MASTAVTTIESLPPELILEILGHLDTPPPSETRLHDQPDLSLLHGESNLKTASLVCKTWHALARPLLFRHVAWEVDLRDIDRVNPPQYLSTSRDPVARLDLMAFLRDTDLARYVDSFTMVVRDSLEGVVVGGPRLQNQPDDMSRLLGHPDGPFAPSALTQPENPYRDYNWVWDMLFDIINPKRITVIASPQLLGKLFSTRIPLHHAWAFNRGPIHILSLSRDTRSEHEAKSKHTQELSASEPSWRSSAPTPASSLFSIRDWTHLLLNEGSFTGAYKNYEFFHLKPPSILGPLLGSPERDLKHAPLRPPTLTSLAYVAVFPLSTHFNALVNNLPRLDRLFVQVVPRDDGLKYASQLAGISPSDLWMERNSCYSLIMRQLVPDHVPVDDEEDDMLDHVQPNTGSKDTNWVHLREFSSGDAADVEAWELAVTHVCRPGSRWHVESEGVFVKGSTIEQSTVPGSDDAGDEQETPDSPFRGNLQRFSFNGTARLPYSPMDSIESYVFAAELPWVYTHADTMEIDFFALLQDVAGMGGGNGISTIGDMVEMVESGNYGIWGIDDDEEENDDIPHLIYGDDNDEHHEHHHYTSAWPPVWEDDYVDEAEYVEDVDHDMPPDEAAEIWGEWASEWASLGL